MWGWCFNNSCCPGAGSSGPCIASPVCDACASSLGPCTFYAPVSGVGAGSCSTPCSDLNQTWVCPWKGIGCLYEGGPDPGGTCSGFSSWKMQILAQVSGLGDSRINVAIKGIDPGSPTLFTLSTGTYLSPGSFDCFSPIVCGTLIFDGGYCSPPSSITLYPNAPP